MNTKNSLDILQEDIVVPEIVQEKADAAFAAIHREALKNTTATESLPPLTKSLSPQSRRKHRKKIIATAFAAALAVCTATAGAAAFMKWSSALEKGLQVTEEQKQTAEDSGLASFPDLSVTNGDVTVTLQQCIADNYYAFLSFKVEGYTVEPGIEPGFDGFDVQVNGEGVTSGGSFFDGLVRGEDGKAVLADGSPIPVDENGNSMLDYMQEDGSLEYRINLAGDYRTGSLLNKPIHVTLANLGYYTEKAEAIETAAEGTWEFDWVLGGDGSIYTAECNEPLGDTGATVTGAEISPISIKAIYDFPRQEITETGYDTYYEEVNGETREITEPFEHTTYKEPPALIGVKLKDGTLLTHLYMGPGQLGYTDDTSNQYVYRFAIDRILDVDQVQSLLFKKDSPDIPELESGYILTEDDMYIVDIR